MAQELYNAGFRWSGHILTFFEVRYMKKSINGKWKGMHMKKIKIMPEYKCFPVWIYGENGELIENDLPTYLIEDKEINSKFVHIQEIYDGLFLDTEKEFKYIGFKENEQRETFFRDLLSAINLLKSKLNDEYIIEDNTDYQTQYYYL